MVRGNRKVTPSVQFSKTPKRPSVHLTHPNVSTLAFPSVEPSLLVPHSLSVHSQSLGSHPSSSAALSEFARHCLQAAAAAAAAAGGIPADQAPFFGVYIQVCQSRTTSHRLFPVHATEKTESRCVSSNSSRRNCLVWVRHGFRFTTSISRAGTDPVTPRPGPPFSFRRSHTGVLAQPQHFRKGHGLSSSGDVECSSGFAHHD